ncbi:L,D-transpeptidase family protein [Aliiroseovarius sp.]|uniref:L,D-transpeptidase family protein n=1 Tax=Aliiroseovarius sp. TaxID=1872442 RepID=UPI00262ADC7B|nr:L,D-transpeptidase family protein [Aliiroseovarius sp.]
MRYIMTILAAVGVMALSSCAKPRSKFLQYDGPEVTRIAVFKDTRTMYLMNGNVALKSYSVDLGFAPEGHKQFEGDGRTPEGRYFINRRNPESSFHLSLGISYPNNVDRDYAQAQGRSPGGDIFIHGGPRRQDPKGPDWTAGCISVSDEAIEVIYSMVRNGTPVDIYPVNLPAPTASGGQLEG